MKPERLAEIRKRHANARNGYDAANNATYAEHVGELLTYVEDLATIIGEMRADMDARETNDYHAKIEQVSE